MQQPQIINKSSLTKLDKCTRKYVSIKPDTYTYTYIGAFTEELHKPITTL